MQRSYHWQHANVDPTNQSCGRQHHIIESGSLQDGPNDEDNNGYNNRVRSRRFIRDPALVQGFEEGTQLDHSCQEALPEPSTRRVLRYPWELLQELVHY